MRLKKNLDIDIHTNEETIRFIILWYEFLKVHDLQTKLTSARETIQQLKDQLNKNESDRRQIEQQATTYKLQIDELRRQFDDTATERDRSKSALESSHHERSHMEKIRIVRFFYFNALMVFILFSLFQDTQYSNWCITYWLWAFTTSKYGITTSTWYSCRRKRRFT